MRRATVTIGPELESMLDAYLKQQDAAPALTSIVQAALREYLARRGFTAEPRQFHVTPARKGSGLRDVSLRHDRYLAEK